MWDLPGPGLKPVYPALAGEFLTTVPPGKPLRSFLAQGPRSLGTEENKLLPFLPLDPGVQTPSSFLLEGPEYSAPSPLLLQTWESRPPVRSGTCTALPGSRGQGGHQEQSCGRVGGICVGGLGEEEKGGSPSCLGDLGRQRLKGNTRSI